MAYSAMGNPLGAALAELRAQRKMLDDAIAALEKVIAAQQQPNTKSPPEGGVFGLFPAPPKSLAGMTIPEAATTVIKASGQPMTNREIADALEKGGLKHESEDFPNTINSVLRRAAEQHGTLVRVDQKWHLAEWTSKGS